LEEEKISVATGGGRNGHVQSHEREGGKKGSLCPKRKKGKKRGRGGLPHVATRVNEKKRGKGGNCFFLEGKGVRRFSGKKGKKEEKGKKASILLT